jgi:hypothetical protein
MKKMMILAGLLIGLNAMLFSLEEAWLSMGPDFGAYAYHGADLEDFYPASPGINFTGYGFVDRKNVGYFFNYGFLFPLLDNIEGNLKPVSQLDFIIGVGFRYEINERLNLHFGIGPEVNFLYLLNREDKNVKSTDYIISFGIGEDIGIKFDITDTIYLDVGATLTYNFAALREIESTTDNWKNTALESSGWVKNFSMPGIRPYIAVGFNIYQERARWGKPEPVSDSADDL